MFFQGLTFAMGFIVGCMLITFLVVLLIAALECLRRVFAKSRPIGDKVVDIGPWVQARSYRKSSSAGSRPAS